MERPIEVAAGLLRQGNAVLVCQRAASARHPLRWEFPGGKIEGSESPRACLARELREELGVDAEVGELVSTIDHSYAGGPSVRIHFFAVPRFEGTLANRVFERVVWQPLARLAELDFLDADRPLVARLMASAPNGGTS
jgi:8-oxo-dGTP diphosphatase